MIRPAACGVFVTIVTIAIPAAADVTTARAHYERGQALYEIGEYQRALDEFKAAHLEKSDPAFLYNIAQCYRQLGDPEKALTFYKRYVSLGPPGPLRDDTERRIQELELARPLKPQEEQPPAPASSASQTLPPGASEATRPPPIAAPVPISPIPSPIALPPILVKEEPSPPFYRRWWFWTLVGVAAAGVATTIAVLSHDSPNPDCLGISPCGSVR